MPSEKSSIEKIPESSFENSFNLTVEKLFSAADVEAVYAKPIQHGDTLIIPAAEVFCSGGFGMGSGEGPQPADGDANYETAGSGSGGGGGGYSGSRPVAVIIADANGVRVEPVVDPTKMALALFTTLGFMVGMVARMSSSRKFRLKK